MKKPCKSRLFCFFEKRIGDENWSEIPKGATDLAEENLQSLMTQGFAGVFVCHKGAKAGESVFCFDYVLCFLFSNKSFTIKTNQCLSDSSCRNRPRKITRFFSSNQRKSRGSHKFFCQ